MVRREILLYLELYRIVAMRGWKRRAHFKNDGFESGRKGLEDTGGEGSFTYRFHRRAELEVKLVGATLKVELHLQSSASRTKGGSRQNRTRRGGEL